MSVTAAQLRRAAKAVTERDNLIRQALSEGWTQRAVAAETGLTPGRIGQIALAAATTKDQT